MGCKEDVGGVGSSEGMSVTFGVEGEEPVFGKSSGDGGIEASSQVHNS